MQAAHGAPREQVDRLDALLCGTAMAVYVGGTCRHGSGVRDTGRSKASHALNAHAGVRRAPGGAARGAHAPPPGQPLTNTTHTHTHTHTLLSLTPRCATTTLGGCAAWRRAAAGPSPLVAPLTTCRHDSVGSARVCVGACTMRGRGGGAGARLRGGKRGPRHGTAQPAAAGDVKLRSKAAGRPAKDATAGSASAAASPGCSTAQRGTAQHITSHHSTAHPAAPSSSHRQARPGQAGTTPCRRRRHHRSSRLTADTTLPTAPPPLPGFLPATPAAAPPPPPPRFPPAAPPLAASPLRVPRRDSPCFWAPVPALCFSKWAGTRAVSSGECQLRGLRRGREKRGGVGVS